MTQNSPEHQSYWCPFGRISLQQISAGHTDIVSSGAFNLAVVSQQGTNDVVYPSSRCIGTLCPFFVPPESRAKDDSMCRMAKDPSRRVMFSACMVSLAIILAGLTIAGAIVWVNILSKGI